MALMIQIDFKYSTYLHSPIGLLGIYANEDAITGLRFEPGIFRSDTNEILYRAQRQLIEYFEHKRQDFDLALCLSGTSFQRLVWEEIAGVKYGRTSTYGAIAKKIARPKAVRAVGKCTGLNPVPIIIPCHRIVGAHGALTGYRGGLELKKWLLAHENPVVQLDLFASDE